MFGLYSIKIKNEDGKGTLSNFQYEALRLQPLTPELVKLTSRYWFDTLEAVVPSYSLIIRKLCFEIDVK